MFSSINKNFIISQKTKQKPKMFQIFLLYNSQENCSILKWSFSLIAYYQVRIDYEQNVFE